jgi:glycylpeptide N-tetradecanoyltransferase
MNLTDVSAETIKEIPEEIIKKIKTQINKIERNNENTYPLRESDIKENKSKFWTTQPVMQINDNKFEKKYLLNDEELDKLLLIDLSLPQKFSLCKLNLRDEETLDEVYKLLKKYYMKSYDGNFIFTYPKKFLQWFFLEQGENEEITIGLKVKDTNKLVGFLGAIKMKLQVHNKELESYYCNFLCLHNKLRNKRASTILIKYLSKLCRENNSNLGVYAARYCVHRPLNVSQIYIRPINYKKLCEIGYCYHDKNIKLENVLLNYKLDDKLNNEKFVKLEEYHIKTCFDLFNEYSNKFNFHPNFTIEQFKNMLLSDNFVTYVIENDEKEAEDFISFYKTTTIVLNNKKYKTFNVANLSYYTTINHSLYNLLDNLLIISKQMNFDLFSALDIMENKNLLEIFNFFKSRDTLNYYLYNYNSNQLSSQQVGFVNM